MRSKEMERNGSNNFNVLENNVKRLGYWNVRSMNGRKEELVAEMKKYRLEVLGVSELQTKVRGNRMKQIGDVLCVFSGVQEGKAKGGVAIMLSERFGFGIRQQSCSNCRGRHDRMKMSSR